MTRLRIPDQIVTEVLVHSRRRCALCFGLLHTHRVVAGQIAHIDRNPANNTLGNLAWLCLLHHDQYDSRTSQSKGLTEAELLHHRDDLYAFNESVRCYLDPTSVYITLSVEAEKLARYMNEQSSSGRKFDPQRRLDALPSALNLAPGDVELAIDELRDLGLVELGGTRDYIYAADRLFWQTDALFAESDPALDAQGLARFLVVGTDDQVLMVDIAAGLGWTPRRLNPAASYLANADVVMAQSAMGSAPYYYRYLQRTVTTRRFVRDLDSGAR